MDKKNLNLAIVLVVLAIALWHWGPLFFVTILVISFLIFFHELGHFLAAKQLGVCVNVFSIGFGEKIYTKKFGSTTYVLSAIPLGGYVQLKGQDDANPALKNYDKDSYNTLSPWGRIYILLAGPFFNLILAFFIYIALGFIGVEKLAPVVGQVMENSAAKSANIMPNDKILSIDGKPIEEWDDISKLVTLQTMNIEILRDKTTLNLRKIRLKKGFDFHTKELRITLDEDGNLKSTRFETSTPSHDLIEDCMLLANQAAAKRIEKGIFRNHAAIDNKKIEFLLMDLASIGIDAKFDKNIVKMVSNIQNIADEMKIREEVDKLIIKAQKKAEYSPLPEGHFGLGFDDYTHFTSPIRRYSDLILHRLLKADLENDEKLINYLLLNIDETCISLNKLEREADKVAYDFIDRKFARWAVENIGQNFICYIDENTNITTARLDDKLKGARIFITNYTCDVLTKVLVKITDADIISAKIYGRVVKKLDV